MNTSQLLSALRGCGSHLQMLQDERTVFPEGLDQSDDARVLGRDAVRDGRRDADDFLEHFDEGIIFVFARLDLAGVHAEGGFEVHSLLSVRLLAAFGREGGGKRNTCMGWWRCAA